MKAALLAFVMVVAATSKPAGAEAIAVYLFTNETPSGTVDEQLKARQESLQDLKRVFADEKYQGTFALVPNRAAADLIVELLSRGETTTSTEKSAARQTDNATASASFSSSVTRQRLHFRLTSGQLNDDLTTEAQLPWPKMAERAVDDILKWAQVHRRGAAATR